jgi:hypothetical protein
MTKDDYQKAIPTCCIHRTFEEHADNMLFCWGITSGLVQEQGESYCDKCSENLNCINQGDSK